MGSRIGGSRRKTRHTFTKENRQRGKISISRYLQKFNEGDKVYLDVEPAVHSGTYCRRFIGKTATVKKRSGKCYEVAIKDGNKPKTLIVHPVHLKKV